MDQHPFLNPRHQSEDAQRAREAAGILGPPLVDYVLQEAQRAQATPETLSQQVWMLRAMADQAQQTAHMASQFVPNGYVQPDGSFPPPVRTPPPPLPTPPPSSDGVIGDIVGVSLYVLVVGGFIGFIIGLMIHFGFIQIIQGHVPL
jgi:hypothetical protein